jgi:hypothetical protein
MTSFFFEELVTRLCDLHSFESSYNRILLIDISEKFMKIKTSIITSMAAMALMFGGGGASAAFPQIVSGLKNVDVNGTLYDVTFNVGYSFDQLFDGTPADKIFGGTGSVYQHAPTFWNNPFAALDAYNAIAARLGVGDTIAGLNNSDAFFVTYARPFGATSSTIEAYRDNAALPNVDTLLHTYFNGTADLTVTSNISIASFAVAVAERLISIDVKPGSDPNCFNINGHGVIPVAILGSDEFDVTEIDTDTLSFAGLETRMRGNKGPLCSYEYSDGDEFLDLVCHFEDDASNWEADDQAEADLTGKLVDGAEFRGTDSICVRP